jgi:putative transposase
LRYAGIDPSPDRAATTWTDFLRSQAHALLAADFIEAVTLTGARMYILTVIEHASRRIRVLGVTAHPTAAWVTQAARNLAMNLEDAGCTVRYVIRDRDGKFPALFDAILADAGIKTVLSGVRMPRMNSIMERWIQGCRHELLDRTLVWNQRHPLPEPITDPDTITRMLPRFPHRGVRNENDPLHAAFAVALGTTRSAMVLRSRGFHPPWMLVRPLFRSAPTRHQRSAIERP